MGFIAPNCDHLWKLHDEKLNWHYEYDLDRHGLFIGLRDRIFGPLGTARLGTIELLERSTFIKDDIERTWYCQKCRKFDTEVVKL